jgi:hypothetical protein
VFKKSVRRVDPAQAGVAAVSFASAPQRKKEGLENAPLLAQTQGVPAGDAFLGTQIVFLVVSGVSTAVLAGVAFSSLLRSSRAALAYLRTVAWPVLTGARVARRFRELRSISSTARLQPGALCRVSGRVEALTVTSAEYSGAASVLCKYECGEQGGGGAARGQTVHDFLVRLDDGSTVRVRARDAAHRHALSLVDRQPQRWNGKRASCGWYWESRLAAGDEVEVIGHFQREIDATAPRAGRQPALGWAVLAGVEGLYVRFGTRQLIPAGEVAPLALPRMGSRTA